MITLFGAQRAAASCLGNCLFGPVALVKRRVTLLRDATAQLAMIHLIRLRNFIVALLAYALALCRKGGASGEGKGR